MARSSGKPAAGRWRRLGAARVAPLLLVAAAATVTVVCCLVVALFGSRSSAASAEQSRHHDAVLRAAATLLVEVEFAESGQRGYLLTGRPSYLQTYSTVMSDIPQQVAVLQDLALPADKPLTRHLAGLVQQKQAELSRTIELRRTRGLPAALSLVNSDVGTALTNDITRDLVTLEQAAERRSAAANRSAGVARSWAQIAVSVGIAVSLGLLGLLLWLVRQRRRLVAARRQGEEARERLVEELSRLATHDALTGLPNRRLVADRLEQALIRRTPERRVSVLFVDLDRFKQVNDHHGHLCGDEVLVEAARRMRTALRPTDTLARVGGDEFVVVCEGLVSEEEGRAIAERLQEAASATVRGLAVGASVGLAFAPPPAATEAEDVGRDSDAPGAVAVRAGAEELLNAADAAMYQAKERGRGRVSTYDAEVEVARRRRRGDLGGLSEAFDAGRLWVAYQPVVHLDSSEIVAVEALLRWTDPERGVIPPDQFIPIAEESGLIVPIGEFVLRTACTQVAEWNRTREATGASPLSVAVNVSGCQLSQPGFLGMVQRTLSYSGVPANLLCLEVTETVLIDAVGAGDAELDRLSELGVRIALDDFGTGYSSLAYLRRFPIDIVKIDRSFVGGLGSNEEDGAIVSAIVGLAHSLGRDAVAEGIEETSQADILRNLKCPYGQGYLYAKPLTALDLEALLLSASHQPSEAEQRT